MTVDAPTRPGWGGRREGAGAKPLTDEQRFERQLLEPQRSRLVELASEKLIERVGLAPRRRLMALLAAATTDEEREAARRAVPERTDGPWLANFCLVLCKQTIGRWSGLALEFYPEQQAFLDDALAFNDDGERLYSTAVWQIPRKNGKTTTTSGIALALVSPAEGEGKPSAILAAGSAKQAAPLYDQAADFINGDPLLRTIFLAAKAALTCPANGGSIERVAGDGKLNHGLNPYAVAADELHAWTSPKQKENWAALTTADGARDDAVFFVISTSGWDLMSILGQLHTQAQQSPFCEYRPEMGGGGYITRDTEARLLVHCYAIAPGTPLSDLDEFKRANPAPWRTLERIKQDLAKRHIDESTKRRLYGNEWTSAKDVWIKRDMWNALADASVGPEPGDMIATGTDASHTHDTTAVGWATKLEDGRIAVRAKVFAVRRDSAAHCRFNGGEIKLAAVEKFMAGELLDLGVEAYEGLVGGEPTEDLASDFRLEFAGYDPRFFARSAELLSDEGINTVSYEPTGKAMQEAIDAFYNDVLEGRIVHDGDPVLAAHVDAASGEKTESGWRVRRMKASRDIDALIAVVIAADLARSQLPERGSDRSFMYAVDGEGKHVEVDDEKELAEVLGISVAELRALDGDDADEPDEDGEE